MDLMTTAEVAEYLRIPEATLRYARHKGEGGPRSFRMGGRRVMYRRQDVDAWLMEQINAERDDKDKLVSL
ncbi:helix-turn-helix transcriptional regulator [Janibacter hoylei]|uniref:helix-turn-helix transcriptional regulator n=1 Tax=Janibacter hoylei TaxID=364298 RepID=UPI0021A2C714|nr:helix-turn-helix domain-containing protein [Janibacter hoylei]MCT1618496.1 helix-turn-helix domain-containing protein [Janibacter hoylei]MCT2294090.1 helix-turn-helix domain-containing protein [Janibacter hoylei]